MPISNINLQRLIVAVFVSLILSVILSFGTFTQAIFVNAVLGDALSLHDAVYQTGLTGTTTFLSWIKLFYSWPYFASSFLVCYITLRYKNIRALFWSLTIGVFISVSIVDTIFLLCYASSYSDLLESYLSNSLGSPVVAVILIMLMMLTQKLIDHIPLKPIMTLTLVSVSISALLLLIVFIFVKNVIWATKSDVLATLNPQFHGDFSISKNSKERFGVFLEGNENLEKLAWLGMFSNMQLKVSNSRKKVHINLYLFEGCSGMDSKYLVKKANTPNQSFKNLNDFTFTIPDGMGEMKVYSDKSKSGTWKITESEKTLVTVLRGEKSNEISMRVFAKDSEFIHENWFGEAWYRFKISTVGTNGFEPRKLSLEAGGKKSSYEIVTDENAKITTASQCKSINTTDEKISIPHFQMTALLRVSYPRIETLKEIDSLAITTIKGLSGQFNVENINSKNLEKYITNGDLVTLNLMGDFEEIYIDGSKLEYSSKRWLYLNDSTVTVRARGSALEFRGEARDIAVEGQNIRKTRWDRFKSYFTWVGICIGGAFLYLLKMFGMMWKRNDSIFASAF